MKTPVSTFVAAALLALVCPVSAAGDAPAKNVLWIYLEDVSGWFSCYGDEIIETPNIDAVAASGVRFDRFYTPAGVCSAMRSATITGMMQTSIGAHHHRSRRPDFRGQSMGDDYDKNVLPSDVVPVPVLFRKAGFYTFNEGGGKDDFNFDWDPETFYDYRNKKWNFKGAEGGSEWTGCPEGKPWFGQIQLAGGKLGRKTPKVVDRAEVPVPPYYPDIPLVREEIAHHYDCLIETDKAVGEIIAALKRDGLYENTVIFMFSDHGYLMHRHKQYLYDGGIHMPCIVAGPGVATGKVREDLVSSIDVAAASLAVAGIPVPEVMEGRDFLADGYQPREYVISARDRCDHTYERIRAVVTPQFKYLKNYLTDRPFMNPSYKDGWAVSKELRRMMAEGEMNAAQLVFFGDKKPAEELYDLAKDPHEINNLAADPEFKAELEKHRAILSKWIAETGDQGQKVDSDIGLLCTMKRWGEKCVNPEYDRVRAVYAEWKAKQPEKKAVKPKPKRERKEGKSAA